MITSVLAKWTNCGQQSKRSRQLNQIDDVSLNRLKAVGPTVCIRDNSIRQKMVQLQKCWQSREIQDSLLERFKRQIFNLHIAYVDVEKISLLQRRYNWSNGKDFVSMFKNSDNLVPFATEYWEFKQHSEQQLSQSVSVFPVYFEYFNSLSIRIFLVTKIGQFPVTP